MTTLQTIQNSLQALGFNNPSNAAIFNKIADALAPLIDNTVTEINNTEANILSTITSKNYGKAGYYTSAALAFQDGYNLTANAAGYPVYAVIDPTAQVVNQAAFEEIVSGSSSSLFLKIANLNTLTGLLQPLTPAQLSAFNNYFVNFQIPGIPVTVISNPPDIISFSATATVYKTYDLSILQTTMEAELFTFMQAFPFDGEFYNGDLKDYMTQNVPGCRDFYIYNTQINGIPFGGFQSLPSGYFNFDPTILNLTNISFNSI